MDCSVMTEAAEPVFQLDEGGATPSPQPASSGGTPSCSTPSPDPHKEDSASIALERRVVPLLEFSEDICSICLEEYTSEDPGAPTTCGHHYHLQCIMQWAQRSRECPLCFKSLQLEDEEMNALLPFGEYVSPQQRASEAASLETWELERLLLRLAAASQREHTRHRHRSSARASAAAAAAGGEGGSGRHRRQGSRGEASAPQPIRGSEAAPAASGWMVPGEGSSSAAAAAAAMAGGRAASAPGPAGYPSRWPPAASSNASSSGAGGLHDSGHVVSPGSRSGPLSLKSRLASLRLKDKLERSAKEIKSLFSPGSGSSGRSGEGSATHR